MTCFLLSLCYRVTIIEKVRDLHNVASKRQVFGGIRYGFLFGSDYPFITPERWLEDFEKLDYFKPDVKEKLMWRNAQRLLAHTAVGKMTFSG